MKTFNPKLFFFALLPFSLAQFPAAPECLTAVSSKVDSSVKISYKRTDLCETSLQGKAYSGFVHLPGNLLSDIGGYDINTYFIYFEAHHNPLTAPLAIYLAGGPGESSIYTALSSESGPCYVNAFGNDTELNPWSFNNHVNMLYIDQPVQAGFSYDNLVSATMDLTTGTITPQNFTSASSPHTNVSFVVGTFPSQDPGRTTNTTVASAKALWHFAENWLSSFPGYSTSSNKVSVWANSYGGFWGPEVAALFNKEFKELPTKHPLHAKMPTFDTLGITNGCIDFLYSMEGYPQFAYNNTYGVHFITETVYQEAMNNMTKPEGCLDLVNNCRLLGDIGDSDFSGSNETVNEACTAAFDYCFGIVSAFDVTNRSNFDVAVLQVNGADPCPYYLPVSNYLNTAEVQSNLGVPLNFTYDSNVVTSVFGFSSLYQIEGTGDAARQAGMPNMEYLLDSGIKIAMVFGDRDYRCPWTGGEATAKAARWQNQNGFLAAGYEEIQGISHSAHGAVVKQYGQLSFSRVFDSGHAVSAYAPEAVYNIFMRSMFDKDVATGKTHAGSEYHTTGPVDSWRWRNTLPAQSPETCIVEGKFTDVNPWNSL